ncbi:CPCC family cysteine-rich protein [Streptomyces sp. NPDC005195]|uniref:CPCC family cysteine-rich protein n=1 Tax=Streptomyces sp. NPDC005195 TaxID=3154561 RepID=UPI0033A5A12D
MRSIAATHSLKSRAVPRSTSWEDHGQDEHDANEVHGGPNHGLSLWKARRNFETIGACNEHCAQFVRAPLPEEHPHSGTPYGTGTLYSWS